MQDPNLNGPLGDKENTDSSVYQNYVMTQHIYQSGGRLRRHFNQTQTTKALSEARMQSEVFVHNFSFIERQVNNAFPIKKGAMDFSTENAKCESLGQCARPLFTLQLNVL